MNDGCCSQLCFLCTDSGYHSGKGHHKGSHDKIALFVSPDKAMPRPELRPDRCSGHRSLTDIKAGTKKLGLRGRKARNRTDPDFKDTRIRENR